MEFLLSVIFLLISSIQYSNSISRGMDVGMYEIEGARREITGQDTFPYMVHVTIIETTYKKNGKRNILKIGCGGSIISEIAVLTAAHCIQDVPENVKQEVFFRAGLVHLLYEQGQVREMTKYVRHERYVGDCPLTEDYSIFCYSDILIAFVKQRFTLGRYVKIAKLCTAEDDIYDKEGWIAGWGLNEDGEEMKMLKMAYMNVMPHAECKAANSEIVMDSTIVCLTSDGKRSGCCEGDSGGPFDVDGVVYAIASFGDVTIEKDGRIYCDPADPSVFTKIAPFREWIDDVLSRGPPERSISTKASSFPTRRNSCPMRAISYRFV